jgi:tetratricopeptide (TPR) repeat protein
MENSNQEQILDQIAPILQKSLQHNQFGSILFKSNKLDLALDHFKKASDLLNTLNIPYTNTILNQANVYAQKKDYQNALSKYEEAIHRSPHNPKNPENNQSAIKDIVLNPKLNSKEAYIDAHTNAGFTLLGMQEPEKAYQYCLLSMELQPDNQDNFINFSNALRMTGRRDEAVDLTWKAIVNKYRTNHPNIEKDFTPKCIDVQECKNLTPDNEEGLKSETINIISMKWGTKYGPEYVNKLYRGFKKNTNRPFNFILFTDNTEGLLPEI